MLEPFRGFPPDAFAFYAELSDDANNAKAWFDVNRQRYEQAVRIPMEALLARADDDGFGNGKVYRPNRDVRFSKDKRPYKDHCGAVISFRDGTGRASRYVQVSAHGLMAASGYWELSRDQLVRFRDAVDDERTGAPLVDAVASARGAGLDILGSELTRAPRGVDPDHPRIELLRHKRLAASRAWGIEPWLHTSDAYDRIVEVWRTAEPIAAWLERHVGPAQDPPRRRGDAGRSGSGA
jgi:uncharacterized protein (TIGR02453 family)